jgi:putative hydrolase of the HAD superfamily
MKFYRPLGPIKALTFDLDDTLYNNHPIIQAADQALTQFIAKNYPKTGTLGPKDWRDIKVNLLNNKPELYSDMGKLRWLTLHHGLRYEQLSNSQHQLATDACFAFFYHARSNFQVDKNIHSLLKKLGESRPLIAITNGNVNLQQIGIDRYFSHSLHASVARPMKPARHMFDEAASLLNIAPEFILHVGDNLQKDIHGAINAGFQAAWYACDRHMHLANEPASVLPTIQLDSLEELHLLK